MTTPVSYAVHRPLGRVLELVGRFACGEQEPDRLGDEGPRRRRGWIGATRVIADARRGRASATLESKLNGPTRRAAEPA